MYAYILWAERQNKVLFNQSIFYKEGKKNAKKAAFFYKERKRTQRTLRSFIKNVKERRILL